MPKMNKEEKLLLEQNVDYKQVKDELTLYINQEIKKGFFNEIEKSNKRLIKEKNKKILARDVIIILLLLFSGYLMYILYHNNYFDRFFNKTQVKENSKTETKTEEKKQPTLEELANSYGYLLDKVNINSSSDYLNEFYTGNLTPELENYIALSTIDINTLTVEDDYNILEDEKIKNAYSNIFSQDHKYTAKNFKYNGFNLRYISKLESYISNELLTGSVNNIKRQIIAVDQANNQIKITTVEGLVTDNMVYNILTKEVVGEYIENKLNDYQDRLNVISYIFDNNKKLVSITK